MAITKFTVLGLRCSGTNFVEAAISENFDLELTWEHGWKHWIGHHDFSGSENTLFIGVVRDPLDWVRSLYHTPHHLASPRRSNFLDGELCSIGPDGAEVMQDRNPTTGQRYRNIFEMRAHKYRYLLDVMPREARHYALLRYEDVKARYGESLDRLRSQFDLHPRHKRYRPISTYVGQTMKFPERLTFRASRMFLPWVHKRRLATSEILARLDVPLEQRLGYLPEIQKRLEDAESAPR